MSENEQERAHDILTHQGIAAYRSGDREQARGLFRQAIAAAPDDQLAWVWLAACTEDGEARRRCLTAAIAINPGNEAGQKAAASLQKMGLSPPPLPPLPSLALAPDAQARDQHQEGTSPWRAWVRRSLGLTLSYALFLAFILATRGWIQLAGFGVLLVLIPRLLQHLPNPAHQGWEQADRIGGILSLGSGMVVVSVFAFFVTGAGFPAFATGLTIGGGMGVVYSVVTGSLLLRRS